MPRQPYSVAVPSDEEERFPSSSLRFLSPVRGTERVVKTIEGRFSKRLLLSNRKSQTLSKRTASDYSSRNDGNPRQRTIRCLYIYFTCFLRLSVPKTMILCPELFFASGLHLAPALWASMHIPPVNPVRTTS